MITYRIMDTASTLPSCLHSGALPISACLDTRAYVESVSGIAPGTVAHTLHGIAVRYGACGVLALEDELIIGKIRAYPQAKSLSHFEIVAHGYLPAHVSRAGADNLAPAGRRSHLNDHVAISISVSLFPFLNPIYSASLFPATVCAGWHLPATRVGSRYHSSHR